MWPEFIVVKGCVFLKSQWSGDARHVDLEHPVQQESDANHTHILDYFKHRAGTDRKPFFKTKHPDFLLACELGKTICHMWASKLAMDFPRWDFRVYYHGLDPVVRFHRIRKGMRNWLDPADRNEEVQAGSILILDTRRLRKKLFPGRMS
jgi:hypothetical protein